MTGNLTASAPIIPHGLVAQWITRLTTDQKIPGSNPGELVERFFSLMESASPLRRKPEPKMSSIQQTDLLLNKHKYRPQAADFFDTVYSSGAEVA